jgi:hypothetical protein
MIKSMKLPRTPGAINTGGLSLLTVGDEITLGCRGE